MTLSQPDLFLHRDSTDHSLVEYDIYGQVLFGCHQICGCHGQGVKNWTMQDVFLESYLQGYLDVHIKQPQQLHVNLGLFVLPTLLFYVD